MDLDLPTSLATTNNHKTPQNMAKGISLHIGLNTIDAGHYGTNGALRGCENDARAMQRIAAQMGFKTTMLLSQQATSGRLLAELANAAQSLEAGDMLLLTYAGHGSQVRDLAGDEADGKDETWCVYDRMILDDELDAAWKKFGSGVRIVMVSDSCHSGTVSRFLPIGGEDTVIYPGLMKYRCLPPEIVDPVFFKYQDLYYGIKMAIPRDVAVSEASVLLLSGCMDNQLSGDGPNNGLFTGELLKVWSNGYRGSYKAFYSRILSKMPATQTPNYYFTGTPDPVFEAQNVFEIEKGRNVGGSDTVGLGSNGENWRGFTWTLRVDESLCAKLTDDELEAYLRGVVKTGMIDTFKRANELKEQIVNTRGGDAGVSCSAGDKGWHCDGHISIHF